MNDPFSNNPPTSNPVASQDAGLEEIFDAVAVEEPRQTSSAAETLRIIRLVLVIVACIGAAAMALTFWRNAKELAADPPGFRFANTPEQTQAKEELAKLESQLTLEREQLRQMQEFARNWPQQYTGSGAKPGMPLVAEVDRLLAQRGDVEEYHLQNVSRLAATGDEKQAARERVRTAMRSAHPPVGRIGRLVVALNDEELRREFLASLSSADDIRYQYSLYEANALIDLLAHLSPEERDKLLPVIVELARYVGDPGRQRLSATLDAVALEAGALAPLAHHQDRFVCELVRPRLPADVLWERALEALRTQHGQAFSAASWIAGQEVLAERREEVIAALLPRLWMTDGKDYPALAALGRWSDERSADAVAQIGKASGAEPVAAEVCRLLARWSPERLQEVVALQLSNLQWNVAAAPAMREEPAVVRAVAAALREAAPHQAHNPYFEFLSSTATPDDVPWLREYLIRLRSTDLPNGSQMAMRVEQIIARQSREQ
jgi:hypothetical protein